MKILLVDSEKFGEDYISILSNFHNVSSQIATINNWKNLIDQKPDGVIIATNPDSHIEIASYALNYNIPTMIEKPLALSSFEANKLKQFKAPVLVNHIHLFSKKYQEIKSNINGKINKIISNGYNLGPFRNYSSLWDYAPHDLSMILDISNQFPHNIKINELKQESGSLFKIIMDFDSFTSISTVGNGGEIPIRNFTVYSDLNEFSYNNDPTLDRPLENAFNVFIRAINGIEDERLGLELSFKIISILEFCQKNN